MKKLLVVFLCLLTLCLFVACKNDNPKGPTQEKPQGSGVIGTHFCDYQDILDTISLLHSQGDEFDASRYADLDERESAIYNSLPHFICGGSGYCIKDINNDGVDELIMLTERWSLKGLFTLKDGLPVLLLKCDDGGIGKDGKIRAESTEEIGVCVETIYQFYSLVDNALVTEAGYEKLDFTDDDMPSVYARIINGERFLENYFEYTDFILSYSFRDYHNLTPSANITCTRLLDIPTLLEKGEYYSLSMLEAPEYSRIYFLEVYGKEGEIVFSCEDESLYAYEIKVSDQETIVSIYYGDGRKNYYNVFEDDFSEAFYSENILAEHGRTIVCLNQETDKKRLVVRDIFDPNRFYQSYDHEAVNNGTPHARFSQDGKSITLQYRVEGDKNDTTRVLCLEELPILKTQKICYVRYAPSISSDIVMVSSGIRAVLRADTGDAIRLLGDGAIVGGEYESDDGTIRNDWYCIDYKGEICYVTADSFEMSHQLDAPTDEKAPRSFIPPQERASWRDKIINVLSKNNLYEDYEELQRWFLGIALMDLNLDNTPELLTAYAGGSMGNVCVVAYDLETGEEICVLGETPHYQDWDNVYFCIYENDEGERLIVNEGSLRSGLEWYMITSKLNEEFKFDTLFEEVITSDEDSRYYYDGNEVDKAEFEKQKGLFEEEYKEIVETRIQIIYWDTINAKNKSEAISLMAEALVNSEQEFIDFGIDDSTT